ncbi:MAG: bifunctional demethylmenaquinone methyltransferase/2-methoxy-6-polyprenyl-1,4-benzoquinol methylase UbiE [Pseudomonadota bacterium]
MNKRSDNRQTTHFGYETVAESDKADRVRGVFDSVAGNYDLMNDLMSGGIHRLWKRTTIEKAAVGRGHQVLDLAGGTGDLAIAFARQVGDDGHVVLADINREMLLQGRDRVIDAGVAGNLTLAQVNAENLPFADNTFDCITIAFGLRNVTHKDAALASMQRVLKPGGRVLVLEFSKPDELLRPAYDLFSFTVLPFLGRVVANDEASYRYLAESIRMHPDQETLKRMMQDAGLQDCHYHNLTGGIAALHIGRKLESQDTA